MYCSRSDDETTNTFVTSTSMNASPAARSACEKADRKDGDQQCSVHSLPSLGPASTKAVASKEEVERSWRRMPTRSAVTFSVEASARSEW